MSESEKRNKNKDLNNQDSRLSQLSKDMLGSDPATNSGNIPLAIVDTIVPVGYGAQRAGRTEAVGSAYGVEPGFFTKRPVTSTLLTATLGGLAGLGGSRIAPKSLLTPSQAALPGRVGVLAGMIAAGVMRARDRKRILQQSLVAEQAGVEPDASKIRESSNAAAVFGPWGGSHAYGRSTVYDKLTGKDVDPETRSAVGGLTSYVLPTISGWTQHYLSKRSSAGMTGYLIAKRLLSDE